MPGVGAIAEHEMEALMALMQTTIQPLAYHNERATRVVLARYSADGLRSLIAEDPQAVRVARDIATLTNHWHGQDFFLWEWYP